MNTSAKTLGLGSSLALMFLQLGALASSGPQALTDPTLAVDIETAPASSAVSNIDLLATSSGYVLFLSTEVGSRTLWITDASGQSATPLTTTPTGQAVEVSVLGGRSAAGRATIRL